MFCLLALFAGAELLALAAPGSWLIARPPRQVYPVGVPIFFAVMLWRKRDLINPPKEILPPGAGVIPFPSVPQGQGAVDTYGRPSEPDPRLSDRRIAETAFLWRVSNTRECSMLLWLRKEHVFGDSVWSRVP